MKVSILDDFSSGHRENIQHLLHTSSNRVRLFAGDCTNDKDLAARACMQLK